MSRFVMIDKPDPYRFFGAVLRRSRLGMHDAFHAAFAADARCRELMDQDRFLGASALGPLGFPVFSGIAGLDEKREPVDYGAIAERRDALRAEAQAEDLAADQQATIVVLWADDTIRRFARGVLGKAANLVEGYGPRFGRVNDPVSFTAMLRAATNTLRHVSEWDDNDDLAFPYDPATVQTDNAKRAIENITILQRAFGIGVHEPIRDVVSWRVLVAVDGKLGTEPPDYGRFEATIIAAARDIANVAGVEAAATLDSELLRMTQAPRRILN